MVCKENTLNFADAMSKTAVKHFPVASQGSMLNVVLFSIFINDVAEGAKSRLIKFTGVIKLGSSLNATEDKVHNGILRG